MVDNPDRAVTCRVEPWRDASPQNLMDLALARWTAFVMDRQAETAIPVLDGQIFHGDLTDLR